MADQAPPVGQDRATGGTLALPAELAATLVLVRHGESTWVAEGRFQGAQDPPLSELGVRQAGLVADRLTQRDERTPLPIPVGPPKHIWHSPLKRAAETARLIAARQPDTSVPVVALPDLTEIAQGEWEGQPMAEVRARWPRELAAWRRTPAEAHAPGGEPLPQASARVREGLRQILAALAQQPRGDGSTVTTSDALSGVLSARYDPVPGYPTATPGAAEPSEPWAIVVAHDGIFRLVLVNLLGAPLARFWAFPFNLAAITVVALHEGVAALRAHNLSDHLEPLAAEERAAKEARGERRGAL